VRSVGCMQLLLINRVNRQDEASPGAHIERMKAALGFWWRQPGNSCQKIKKEKLMVEKEKVQAEDEREEYGEMLCSQNLAHSIC
jgi:hypothetical protein